MHRTCLPALLMLCVAACRSTVPEPRSPATGPDSMVVLSAPPTDWTALAGRRVRIDAPLSISGNHGLDREQQVIASFGARLLAPTERTMPGAPARQVSADNRRRQLVIRLADDADRDPAIWRSGGSLRGVAGVVEVDEGRVRLRAETLEVLAAPRPAAPVVPGDVRIASLNLENLFNGDGRGNGFPTARGARTVQDYQRQQARLVATLRALDPDIAALMELENDGHGPESSIAQLVEALRGAQPDADWRFAGSAEGPGDDAIRVGIVYRADRVVPLGPALQLARPPLGTASRVPLAQRFRAGDGPPFVVVANHFKSKGCSGASGADADQGDGQSCWNATRLASARVLRDWLANTVSPRGEPTVLLGDFNAYGQED
ncbi:MAG TPA: endonuclease/exonuclease/phosphatase family protein, partial [Luteimonas sp.]|nr:endonuclease/exonuclease/phosphatase family protein [Luteimonas sp.]